MRYVTRNPFARFTIRSERVYVTGNPGCAWCGSVRGVPHSGKLWLLRFHVDGDSPRDSGPIAGGKLFCNRDCAESYTGRRFDD